MMDAAYLNMVHCDEEVDDVKGPEAYVSALIDKDREGRDQRIRLHVKRIK